MFESAHAHFLIPLYRNVFLILLHKTDSAEMMTVLLYKFETRTYTYAHTSIRADVNTYVRAFVCALMCA